MLQSPIPLADAVRSIGPATEDRIDVWIADVNRFTPLPPPLFGCLSNKDHEAASRFAFEDDRRRLLVSRALLRQALSGYTRLPAGGFHFGRTEAGKPFLEHNQRAVEFNVSHSGSVVMIAVAAGRPVGVDVEQMREGVNLIELANSCFTARERAIVFADTVNATARFYQQWACKEAWMKADGRGLSLPLEAFSVVDGGTKTGYLVDPAIPHDWRVEPLPVFDGYAAAVASTSGMWKMSILHVQ